MVSILNFSKSILLLAFISMAIVSCKKEEVEPEKTWTIPVVETGIITNIGDTTAVASGEVVSDGGGIGDRGICWSTHPDPTIADTRTVNQTGIGTYSANLVNLLANTTYYVRAYARNNAGTGYGDIVSFTTTNGPVATIAIGEIYQGGMIFYVDGTGQHGLISATMDQGNAYWGCENSFITGTSTDLGTGQANTLAIVSQCGISGTAARICNELVLNGYDDWYLPSKDELFLMHQNLHLQGLGDFIMSRYWSSSQYDAQYSWVQFFNSTVNQLYYDKDLISYPVRAIRSF